MTNCLGEVRTHIMHYFNSEEMQRIWWENSKRNLGYSKKNHRIGKREPFPKKDVAFFVKEAD